MRRVKAKERKKATHIYCPYCKPNKVEAVWRVDGFADFRYDFACEKHKNKLKDKNNEHLTEADLQTWYR